MTAAPDTALVAADVERAVAEDIGEGDVTGRLMPADKRVKARIISREAMILCGTAWADAVFTSLDQACQIHWQAADGDRLSANDSLATLEGPARALLAGERTALNFLQTLSGVATVTRQFVDRLAGTQTKLLDTRKTIPGLRYAQKYAVRCGGGHNHRMGLYDAYLIKENHLIAFDSLSHLVAEARRQHPALPIIVEVENLAELKEALTVPVDRLLLDNFDQAQLSEAVTLTEKRIPLEVSGDVSLDNIRAIAETGVDVISVGCLTKHIRAIDLSMRCSFDENVI